MTEFNQFKSLMSVLIKSSFNKTRNSNKINTKKNIGKIPMLLLMGFGFVGIAFYLCMMAFTTTVGAVTAGKTEEALYLFLGLGQLIVLFFGMFAAQNYLFLSKDNQLLCSLPLNNRVIFSAKFVMVYLSELSICTLIVLPMILTYAITLSSLGLVVPFTFYLVLIVGLFLLPIIPLLLISIISIPIMYIVSFLRKRALGNGIAMGVIAIACMALYMGAIGSFSSSSSDDNGNIMLPASIIAMLNNIPNIMFFNQPLVKSMLGDQVILNLLFYIGIILVCGGAALVVSTFFYRKALSITIEGTGRQKSSNKEVKIVYNSNYKKTFFIKELKTLLQTPTILMTTLMGIAMPIIMMFFFSGFSEMGGAEGDSSFDGGMFMVTMVTYIITMLSASTNMSATIGFSREGAQINILKTLPLSAKDIVIAKSLLSISITCLISLLIIIFFPFVTKQNFFIGVMLGITNLLLGCGLNFISLYTDLKNPNFKWNNITELTKNNKRAVKPMMLMMAVGFGILIYGMVLSFINLGWVSYLLFFGVTILLGTLLLMLGYRKLFSRPQELFDRIEN